MCVMPDDKNTSNFNIKTFFITSIVTAMSLVVGLFWKDAISSVVDNLVPDRYDMYSNILIAVAVTIAIGIAILLLYRSQTMVKRYEGHMKNTIIKHKEKIENKRKRYEEILKGSEI